MALHDRYQSGDGRVQALDRYLTHLGDRVGNAWLRRTGIGRSTLTQALYLFSAVTSAQRFVVYRDPYAVLFIGLAVLGLAGIGASRGGLVEQMQMEVLRLPKNVFAFLRIFLLIMGLLALATVTGSVLALLIAAVPLPADLGRQLLVGCALTALQAGEYIRRTNPITPSRGGHGHWVS